MMAKDAKRKSREKDSQRNIENECSGLGSVANESSTNGIEQNEVLDTNSEGRNSTREENIIGGQGTIGKILKQLQGLQQAHLNYVDAHKERLEARLQENEVHRSQVIEGMQQLENLLTKLLGEIEEHP